jgi:hypothetical protein
VGKLENDVSASSQQAAFSKARDQAKRHLACTHNHRHESQEQQPRTHTAPRRTPLLTDSGGVTELGTAACCGRKMQLRQCSAPHQRQRPRGSANCHHRQNETLTTPASHRLDTSCACTHGYTQSVTLQATAAQGRKHPRSYRQLATHASNGPVVCRVRPMLMATAARRALQRHRSVRVPPRR